MLYSVNSGRVIKALEYIDRKSCNGYTAAAFANELAFHPYGRTIATSGPSRWNGQSGGCGENERGNIWLWDIRSGTLISKIQPDKKEASDYIWGMTFSEDGNLIATLHSKGSNYNIHNIVKVWDINKSKIKYVFPILGGINNISFNKAGNILAASGLDSSVKLWDLSVGRPLPDLLSSTDEVLFVEFAPDGKLIVQFIAIFA